MVEPPRLINKPPIYILYEVDDRGSEFRLSATRDHRPSMRVRCDFSTAFASWTIEDVSLEELRSFRLEAQVMLEDYDDWNPNHKKVARVPGDGCWIELTSAYDQPSLQFRASSDTYEASIDVALQTRGAVETLHTALDAIIENWEEMYGTV